MRKWRRKGNPSSRITTGYVGDARRTFDVVPTVKESVSLPFADIETDFCARLGNWQGSTKICGMVGAGSDFCSFSHIYGGAWQTGAVACYRLTHKFYSELHFPRLDIKPQLRPLPSLPVLFCAGVLCSLLPLFAGSSAQLSAISLH
jgi:hypothetical protein